MKRRWAWGLLVGLGLVGGSVATVAAVGDDRPIGSTLRDWADTQIGRFVQGRIGRLMVLRAEMNLTDQQRTALRTTFRENRVEIAQTIAPVIAKRNALRDAVLSDNADEHAIRAAADDLGKAIGDAAVKAAQFRKVLKDRVHLTDEQCSKLKDFRSDNDKAIEEFLKHMSSVD